MPLRVRQIIDPEGLIQKDGNRQLLLGAVGMGDGPCVGRGGFPLKKMQGVPAALELLRAGLVGRHVIEVVSVGGDIVGQVRKVGF